MSDIDSWPTDPRRGRRLLAIWAVTSAELRTPITVARGYTELVHGNADDPRVAEDTAVVLDELDKLSRITHRLVTLMLMASAAPREPVDVDAELARALRRWSPTAERAWRVRSAVGVARIVPERLETALDCLLENAVKFTADGDPIELVGVRRPDGWTIAVVDGGAGLAPGRAAELSAASGPVPSESGTGLGLAIARAVVSAWGGRISIEAEPGGGTRAAIWVPADPPGSAAEPYRLPASAPAQTRNP
jgi:signal transduction histidine kinase